MLGIIYSTGKYIKQDITKAVHYYKDASSINYNYAKNNLGIIYKNGIGLKQNLGYAIVLFQEAIKQEEDEVAMYNLASIYLYLTNDINKCIDLLIQSIKKQFLPSIMLLILSLIKKK